MRTQLWGTTYNSPVFTCPTGGEKSFHADGELAVARATKARGAAQTLSTSTSTGVEDVCAHGQPVKINRAFVLGCNGKNRAACRGCGVSGDRAYRRQHHGPQQPDLQTHASERSGAMRGVPRAWRASRSWGQADVRRHRHGGREWAKSSDGLGIRRPLAETSDGEVDDQGHRYAQTQRMKADHGFDGVGFKPRRTGDGELRSTIEALPEVVAEVGGRIPVFALRLPARDGRVCWRWRWARRRSVHRASVFVGLGSVREAGVDRWCRWKSCRAN